MIRIFGIDPGLGTTGWGLIEAGQSNLRHMANGQIQTPVKASLAERLRYLHDELSRLLADFKPHEVAVEETFVNQNPQSTLKLGMARGIALLAPAELALPIAQYLPNKVKKAVVGVGKADKNQVQMMVSRLLPGVEISGLDAADALATAICHAHLRQSHSAVSHKYGKALSA